MLFTLEPLQAAEGDCLLLHWGTADEPHLAVIDGGPGAIYENQLRPRLEDILANRELEQLAIELVMVSHVDNDHVVGIKKLFRDLKREQQQNLPDRPFEVKRLWHNTFNDILGDGIDQYYNKLTATYQASVNGAPNPAIIEKVKAALVKRKKASKAEAAELAYDVGHVLAGHGEGRALRIDHQFLFDAGQTAVLNHPFSAAGKPTLITAEKTPKAKTLSGLGVKIIGPLAAEIEALQEEFDEYIDEKKLTAEAVLAAYSDPSVKNLSSIVCLLTMKKKTILLTGDARGDKILDGLRKAKLLTKTKPLKVDVLKVPHHGSEHNVAADFFEQVIADHYVLSGDGKNANPDRATIEWIVASRGKQDKYEIYLTYPISVIDKGRKAHYDRYNYAWKPKQHSLKAFFDDHDDHAFTVHEKAPFQIDLGDESISW